MTEEMRIIRVCAHAWRAGKDKKGAGSTTVGGAGVCRRRCALSVTRRLYTCWRRVKLTKGHAGSSGGGRRRHGARGGVLFNKVHVGGAGQEGGWGESGGDRVRVRVTLGQGHPKPNPNNAKLLSCIALISKGRV